jgi:DNA mismatch endonuclease (patch repair protein)
MVALLRRNGITGWRRHPRVFGNPDFLFPKYRLAVFVDGCFWHGCPKHATQPASNRAFWREKLARNKTRDRLVTRTLKQRGWSVLRVWQHEFSRRSEPRLVRRIRKALELIEKRGSKPIPDAVVQEFEESLERDMARWTKAVKDHLAVLV